jgi:predicted membrane protein
MSIHISLEFIKNLLLIAGNVIVGAIFGMGFIMSDETFEKVGFVVIGILILLGYHALINWIF